jgi:hypothetical protein
MPRVEFEPTIPVFERAKTVHALDRAATVIGLLYSLGNNEVDINLDSKTYYIHRRHHSHFALELIWTL